MNLDEPFPFRAEEVETVEEAVGVEVKNELSRCSFFFM